MASKANVSGAPVAPLNQILQPLCDALRHTYRRRDLVLTEIDQVTASRMLFALTGSGAVPAQTDRKCILNQLLPRTNPDLWFGILLELRKRAREAPGERDQYEIIHVSIQAFQGTTSQNVLPVLRAEWDLIVARSRQGPAQPHWHAYVIPATPIAYGFTTEAAKESVASIKPYQDLKNRQLKVHFALCANWQKEGGSHFAVLNTPDELKRWIIGALKYIESQI